MKNTKLAPSYDLLKYNTIVFENDMRSENQII